MAGTTSVLSNVLQIILGKKTSAGGVSNTATFQPSSPANVLTAPTYNEHLTDIFTSRQSDDSRTLMQGLFKTDPDVSATVFSYLTLANTDPLILVRDLNGEIDHNATKQLVQLLKILTVPTDYTQGFQLKMNLKSVAEELRYMALLRGGIATELVLTKQLTPDSLRMVDLGTVKWYEKSPGLYKPVQTISGGAGGKNELSLDIPTFFVSFFRRDPTSIYPYSTFVASINTIASRQQVINDLYRIMQKTGYPRMDVKLIEEVMLKNAPANLKQKPDDLRVWMNSRLSEVQSAFEGVRPDQSFVHWDSIEPSMINDKNPGMGVDITSIIETLNAQNQAGLKTMSTVIGRGTQGVNTGSVEARIAAMNADELNEPVAEVLTNVCSYLIQQTGYQGFAEVTFAKAELRPDMELETMRALKVARLRQDLSDGLITDDEYHLMMYNRLGPDSAPILSGTKFLGEPTTADLLAAGASGGNTTALDRSISAGSAKSSTSNSLTKTKTAKTTIHSDADGIKLELHV